MSGIGKHVRRQVVDDVIARMLEVDPSVGVNVFEDPARAIPGENLPLVLVELTDEVVNRIATSHSNPDNYRQIRTIGIDISILATTQEDRDRVSAKIEDDIIRFSNIGRTRDLKTARFANNADGAKRFWTATHTYEFQIHTLSQDPYQIIRTG